MFWNLLLAQDQISKEAVEAKWFVEAVLVSVGLRQNRPAAKLANERVLKAKTIT